MSYYIRWHGNLKDGLFLTMPLKLNQTWKIISHGIDWSANHHQCLIKTVRNHLLEKQDDGSKYCLESPHAIDSKPDVSEKKTRQYLENIFSVQWL
mmetsp:Transcript_17624/g.19132  ORF Transcript_17624/g.19132 Transcript_17624/m.19132 type:complete len:95 (-) Transcript_17624:1466-1750(-)